MLEQIGNLVFETKLIDNETDVEYKGTKFTSKFEGKPALFEIRLSEDDTFIDVTVNVVGEAGTYYFYSEVNFPADTVNELVNFKNTKQFIDFGFSD